MATPNQDGGMLFDSAPVSQPLTVSPAPSNPSASDGMVFDAKPVSQPLAVSVSNTPAAQSTPENNPSAQAAPQYTISATPGSMPGDPLAAKLKLWAQNVQSDLMHGTNLTGVGSVLKAMGAHGLQYGTSEDIARFMGSLPLGLLRSTQGGAEVGLPGQRWQGTKDVIGGALDASTIPSAFVAPEVGEVAGKGTELAGAAADAALSQAGRAARAATTAVRKPFSLQAVQDALTNSHADIQKALETSTKSITDDWHQTVRDLFDSVAKETGVTPEKATSLHDVAANVSQAIKAKAQSLYRQADEAVGGTKFQNYQSAVRNIRRAIREEVGLDPTVDSQLQQRLADAEAGHELAKEQLAAKGLDPKIIETADNLYRKAMSLSDVSKHVQASMSGLRADLASGVDAATEALSPAKLATRLGKLYDTGRLQSGLGEGNAGDLLTAAEETKQRLQDAATAAKQQSEAAKARAAQRTAAVKTNRTVAGAVAGGALGSIPGYALLKHLLGSE